MSKWNKEILELMEIIDDPNSKTEEEKKELRKQHHIKFLKNKTIYKSKVVNDLVMELEDIVYGDLKK